MSCPACTKAAERLTGVFQAGCKGCAARAVSRGPNFRRARDSGYQDRKYRGELEQFGVTHDQVKAAAAADFEQQRKRA